MTSSRGRRTQRRSAERTAANARRLELLALQRSYRVKRGKQRKIENEGETHAEAQDHQR